MNNRIFLPVGLLFAFAFAFAVMCMPLVQAAATVAISSPTNTPAVDVGQFQSVTASLIGGGYSATNTFTFYVVNSVSPKR